MPAEVNLKACLKVEVRVNLKACLLPNLKVNQEAKVNPEIERKKRKEIILLLDPNLQIVNKFYNIILFHILIINFFF